MTSLPDWLLLLLLMAFTTGPFLMIFGAWLMLRRLGVPKRGRLLAIATWADDVGKHEAEVKTATFGDLILFVTLYVIGVTLFVTWYVGKKQTEADAAKLEHSRLEETQLTEQDQISKNIALIATKLKTPTGAPRLISPSADERIIGQHLDFRWEYGNHSRSAKYEIQLIRVSDDDAAPIPEHNAPPIGESCIFPATNSPEQRSRFLAPEGAFIWRVGFGELLNASRSVGRHVEPVPKSGMEGSEESEPNWTNCEHAQPNFRIKEWSAYRKVSFYYSRLDRMYATHKILVGVNAEFAGEDNGAGPFEKDLVKGIAGCLVINKDRAGSIHLRYKKTQCLESVHALVAGETIGRENPLNESGTSFPLEAKLEPIRGLDWSGKLQRKNIDMYIGTLTKAMAREQGTDVMQGSHNVQAGLNFSMGYLDYRSELLVDPADICTDVKCLADQFASVGALEGSTNLQLANMLMQASSSLDTLKVVGFPSPAEMESAYEKGEIRAVLIDNVLKPEMGLERAKVLDELFSQPGWRLYLRNFIGDKKEQFAIAVGPNLGAGNYRYDLRSPGVLTGVQSVARGSDAGEENPGFFARQINCALDSAVVRNLMASSYERYSLRSFGVSLPQSIRTECAD